MDLCLWEKEEKKLSWERSTGSNLVLVLLVYMYFWEANTCKEFNTRLKFEENLKLPHLPDPLSLKGQWFHSAC